LPLDSRGIATFHFSNDTIVRDFRSELYARGARYLPLLTFASFEG
jgi:hypothetical protein